MKQFQRLAPELPKTAGLYWYRQSGYDFVDEVQIVDGEPSIQREGVWTPLAQVKGVDRLWGQAPIPRPESFKRHEEEHHGDKTRQYR